MIRNFVKDETNLNVIMQNNEPLFFGKEVADILGYKDTDKAIRMHVDPKYKIELKNLEDPNPADAAGEAYRPHKTLLKEAGFYSLIFGSQLPQAKEFRDWVFEEVLPQIRRTGSYSLDNGLLKIRDISEEDVQKMTESEKKEFKIELKKFRDLLKDPEFQRKGRNGGLSFWRKIRKQEEELESLRKKVEDVMSILNEF